jgi:hypothetical protein
VRAPAGDGCAPCGSARSVSMAALAMTDVAGKDLAGAAAVD